MTKFINIKEDYNLKCHKQITNYLNPDFIYLPYKEGNIINVKGNEEINKNSVVIKSKEDYICSPISGTVIGMTDNIVNGRKQKTIVIENNFKEKVIKTKASKKDIYNLKAEDISKDIKSLGAFKGSLKGTTMVINGIDLEPYEETFSYLISEHTDQILECVDALINIFKIHKCFFAVKDNDSQNVETLLNQIGTYPNIELKLKKDVYPIGHKEILIKDLVWDSKIKRGVIYLTVEDVYNIYNVLKRGYPITEKLVTITGNALNKSKVVNLKIGTRLADIINNEFKITKKDYCIIINGLLSGYKVPNLDTIITPNVRSVFIQERKAIIEDKCINCGLCHTYCPIKADPRSKYNMSKCLKCGLCNYVCPSRIRLVGDKNE